MKTISTAFVTIFVLCIAAIASPCRAQTSTVPSACTSPSKADSKPITTMLTATAEGDNLLFTYNTSELPQWSTWSEDAPPMPVLNLQGKPITSLNPSGNMIVVPAGKVALIELQIEGSTPPSKVYFYEQKTGETSGEKDLGPDFASITSSFYAKADGMIVIICDDNSESSEDHTWNFGLIIDGKSYDPQIENKGGGSGG